MRRSVVLGPWRPWSGPGIALVVMLLALVPSLAGAAGAGQKIRLAILELRNEASLPEAQIAYLTDQIRGQASKQLSATRFLLMTRESIQELLPPGVTLSDCVRNSSCEVEVGRKIGADYIVTGEVLRIDDELRLNLKVHHCGSGAFLGNTSASGVKIKALETDLAKNAVDLFGKVVQHAGPDTDSWTSEEGGPAGKDGRIGTAPPAWTPTGPKRGVVRFTSDPAGAMVLADGRVLCQSTPCSKALPQGTVSVQMQKERYLVRSEAVLVGDAPDAMDVNWKLAPTFGWLTVQSQPSGLQVSLNGEAIGTTPIERRELDPGPYVIKVADTLYYETGERATIVMGAEKRIDLAPVLRQGAVDVTAVDKDGNDLVAQVSIDGNVVGHAPGVFTAPVGRRNVLVTTQGYEWRSQVVVPERKTIAVPAKFSEAMISQKTLSGDTAIAPAISSDEIVMRSGLMWTVRDNGSGLDWNEAKAYCEACRVGGYRDWRMPTIEELKGLYTPSTSYRTRDVSDQYSAHIAKSFQLTTPWQWSSTRDGSTSAFFFDFGNGAPYSDVLPDRYNLRVLCVRRSRE